MLLLHMQIRRYFNKICDNINYTERFFVWLEVNKYIHLHTIHNHERRLRSMGPLSYRVQTKFIT